MINIYHGSDVQGFLKGEKTHSPFDVQKFRDTSNRIKTYQKIFFIILTLYLNNI